MGKQIITANDLVTAAGNGNKILNFREEDCIVTPEARDKIEEMGFKFVMACPDTTACEFQPKAKADARPDKSLEDLGDGGGMSDIQAVTDQVCSLLREKLPQPSVPGLESIVKKVVSARLTQASLNIPEQNTAMTIHGGVSLIKGNTLLDEGSGPAIPGKVLISDAIRCHQDSPLTATYMKWEKTSFTRTVESPEVNIVVQGELELTVDGKRLNAGPGDIVYMEKGALVDYSTPSMVTLACLSS